MRIAMNRFHHYLLTIYNLHKKTNWGYFHSLGLSQGQPKILEILLCHNGCSQKELADICVLEPATISSLLKKMEKDKLVSRIPETRKDGTHITKIFLTEHGKNLADKVLQCVTSIEDQCFHNFTLEEKESFLSSMKKINQNLKNYHSKI